MDNEGIVWRATQYCKLRGVKPTIACAESGAGKDLLGDLKRGKNVSVERVAKLAAYLGVTTSALLGEKEKPDDAVAEYPGLDQEIARFLCQCSAVELAQVRAFIAGLKASRGDTAGGPK